MREDEIVALGGKLQMGRIPRRYCATFAVEGVLCRCVIPSRSPFGCGYRCGTSAAEKPDLMLRNR